MRVARAVLISSVCLAFIGCGDGAVTPVDGGGGGTDAAREDAGPVDAAVVDGGGIDADGVDAGEVDAAIEVDAAADDAAVPVELTLTSTAYAEGGVIPDAHTCSGANTSPPLEWVGAPAGTLSYAVIFTDLDNGLIHSAIFDIPATRTGLPADVDVAVMPTDVPGARQVPNYSGDPGYAGPCPPSTHTYEMRLYALDVAMLPPPNSTRMQVRTAAMAHSLGEATLTATFTP